MTKDPRLGRLIQFDERSLGHSITDVLPRAAFKPRSYKWRCNTWLDQGKEGACVGFAWSHELVARPVEAQHITNESAQHIYKTAQTLDPWPGEDYDGTSVLAGVKAVQLLYPRAMASYKWAFGIEQVIATLGYLGPVVLGIHWYQGMYTPDEDGFIHVKGELVGGHSILALGVNVIGKFIELHNSWGKDWGVNGECKLSFEDLSTLLSLQGEACIPVGRRRIKE